MKRLNLTTMLVIALAITGCGARTVGTTPNNNNANTNTNLNTNTNVNQNNNNVDPPVTEYLTRRTRLVSLVTQIMGFSLNLGPCVTNTSFEDVNGDDELCWAIYFADQLKVDLTSGVPNMFMPNEEVNQAGTWQLTANLLGFYPYEDADCNLWDDWYEQSFGTLCHKGLIPTLPEPAEGITLEVWDLYLLDLQLYMQQMNSRLMVGEILINTALNETLFYFPEEQCESNFNDVDDQSFECLITFHLSAFNIIDIQMTNFRSDDGFTWAEIFKLTATATEVDVYEGGYSDLGINHWAEAYVDTWARLGLLPPGLTDINSVPDMNQAAHFLYRVTVELY